MSPNSQVELEKNKHAIDALELVFEHKKIINGVIKLFPAVSIDPAEVEEGVTLAIQSKLEKGGEGIQFPKSYISTITVRICKNLQRRGIEIPGPEAFLNNVRNAGAFGIDLSQAGAAKVIIDRLIERSNADDREIIYTALGQPDRNNLNISRLAREHKTTRHGILKLFESFRERIASLRD